MELHEDPQVGHRVGLQVGLQVGEGKVRLQVVVGHHRSLRYREDHPLPYELSCRGQGGDDRLVQKQFKEQRN